MIASLFDHLDASVSPSHSVAHASGRLSSAGFSMISSITASLPDRGFMARGGLLVAWVRGSKPEFRVVGAHTDSPTLRVKPSPVIRRAGWSQWSIEVYGGILNNSWLDRDLGIAGVIIDTEGRRHLVRSPHPVARVPQLAVHLDRDVNDKGLVLNRQMHLTPVVSASDDTSSFIDVIASWSGLDANSIVAHELSLFDCQPAALIGLDEDLVASGRIDNQVSCWAAVEALIALDEGDADRPTSVIALFDHEEVGSSSVVGASGPWLEWILESLHGGDRHSFHVALSSSACLSADGAHGVHPNYPDRHDSSHGPHLGNGPVLKINANQRYATSVETAALFSGSCEKAGISHQTFVSRNDMPCGSTIGPLASTRLGIPTADVGVAQLSMHSVREVCHRDDPEALRRVLKEFLIAD
ncbi:MAG: M18 family aminopeptidase [Actinomycetota bacterium]|nr:M18 family aminopeptidase [Actinomycetota bacterium]MDA2970827.1 M18 family aminopeptidase [Actinomycetota bacterium]MDA3000187.1 M18 family aminopeptidase [Actinomycetota bacterium]